MNIDITKIKEFDWDIGNIDKSSKKHNIHFKEAEEAFFNEPLIVSQDKKHSDTEDRYHCLGHTNKGTLLFISFTVRKKKIRVISARPQNRKETKIYESK